MDHVNVRRAVSKISRKNIAKKTTEFMSVIETLISIQQGISEKMFEFFLRLHSTIQTLTTHAHSPLCHRYANPNPMCIFEDILMKSPHAPRYQREHRLPLKTQRAQNIHSYRKSNLEPEVIPSLL